MKIQDPSTNMVGFSCDPSFWFIEGNLQVVHSHAWEQKKEGSSPVSSNKDTNRILITKLFPKGFISKYLHIGEQMNFTETKNAVHSIAQEYIGNKHHS